ncbi:MAG: metallophosphoesterase [Clostridia bacterium]
MKIIVISDTHNSTEIATSAIQQNKPDRIIFLGDVLSDIYKIEEIYPDIPVSKVAGNCDIYEDEPKEIILNIEGKTFLICHGDSYNVKNGLFHLKNAAEDNNVDICLFGHTHKPLFELNNGIYFLNPGSCKKTYTNNATYAIIEIDDKEINCNIIEVN